MLKPDSRYSFYRTEPSSFATESTFTPNITCLAAPSTIEKSGMSHRPYMLYSASMEKEIFLESQQSNSFTRFKYATNCTNPKCGNNTKFSLFFSWCRLKNLITDTISCFVVFRCGIKIFSYTNTIHTKLSKRAICSFLKWTKCNVFCRQNKHDLVLDIIISQPLQQM